MMQLNTNEIANQLLRNFHEYGTLKELRSELRSRLLRGLVDHLKHVKLPDKFCNEQEKMLHILLADYFEKRAFQLSYDALSLEAGMEPMKPEERLEFITKSIPSHYLPKNDDGPEQSILESIISQLQSEYHDASSCECKSDHVAGSAQHSNNLTFKNSMEDGSREPEESFPIRHAMREKELERLVDRTKEKCNELELENNELRILLTHARTALQTELETSELSDFKEKENCFFPPLRR